MNWLPLAIAAVLAAGVALGAGHSRETRNPLRMMRILEDGRARLRLMLARLEREPAPEQVMGAMCYEPVAMPDRIDYICPVCGERTLYGYPEGYAVYENLPGMRRIITELEGNGLFSATLEETYCGSCHPGLEDRGVTLAIAYPEGDTVRTRVSVQDLMILQGFMSGELSYEEWNDARLPLRDHADRLRTLLGIL